MFRYLLRRFLQMVPTLVIISVISFVIIQLPPGDYLTTYTANLAATGGSVDQAAIAALEQRYGLNQPVYVQYLKWVGGFLRGDFGMSFEWNKPVGDLIWGRLGLTVVVTASAMVFIWVVGFAVGFYSATHKYTVGDYVATFLGFIGLATPDFMFALVLMWVAYAYLGQNVGGLFSPKLLNAPWSLAKLWDMLKHLWIPMIITGTAGTAEVIRIFRANLLDELHRPYMDTARAKGLTERSILLKYPLRVALIPFVATAGWQLPHLVSGVTIVAVVLSLPTAGPLLIRSLMSQDMYLAGTLIMLLSALTVIGTLISDVLLVWLDPRIEYSEASLWRLPA